jgi:propionate CoA-transferase
VVELEGEEWMFYKSFPINVALLRGTAADENGNFTIEKEGKSLEVLPVALATKASGGIVIVQVETLVKAGSLHPKRVKVPRTLVDYIVVAKKLNGRTMVMYTILIFGDARIPLERSLFWTNEKSLHRRAAWNGARPVNTDWYPRALPV